MDARLLHSGVTILPDLFTQTVKAWIAEQALPGGLVPLR